MTVVRRTALCDPAKRTGLHQRTELSATRAQASAACHACRRGLAGPDARADGARQSRRAGEFIGAITRISGKPHWFRHSPSASSVSDLPAATRDWSVALPVGTISMSSQRSARGTAESTHRKISPASAGCAAASGGASSGVPRSGTCCYRPRSARRAAHQAASSPRSRCSIAPTNGSRSVRRTNSGSSRGRTSITSSLRTFSYAAACASKQ